MTDFYSDEALLAEYNKLCESRDSINKKREVLEQELSNWNEKVVQAQAEAHAVASKIDKILIESDYLKLKKNIARLATLLGRPNGPLAHKDN